MKKHKKAEVELNPNNPREKLTRRFRSGGKPSIDCSYSKQVTIEESREVFKKEGVKNADGSYSLGTPSQLIQEYKEKMYSLLEGMGLPSDDTVKYLNDGTVVNFDCVNGKMLRAHIHDDYPDVPNAHRIGWFLVRLWNLELDLQKADYKSAIDMLLRMIEDYSKIILVSIESNIVIHSTQEGTKEKVLRGERSKRLVFEEAAKLPQHLSKTRMAQLIAPKVNLSVGHICNKILPLYKK